MAPGICIDLPQSRPQVVLNSYSSQAAMNVYRTELHHRTRCDPSPILSIVPWWALNLFLIFVQRIRWSFVAILTPCYAFGDINLATYCMNCDQENLFLCFEFLYCVRLVVVVCDCGRWHLWARGRHIVLHCTALYRVYEGVSLSFSSVVSFLWIKDNSYATLIRTYGRSVRLHPISLLSLILGVSAGARWTMQLRSLWASGLGCSKQFKSLTWHTCILALSPSVDLTPI
jgi:hypothetical protein